MTKFTPREQDLLGGLVARHNTQLMEGMTAETYGKDIASPAGQELLEWQIIQSKIRGTL